MSVIAQSNSGDLNITRRDDVFMAQQQERETSIEHLIVVEDLSISPLVRQMCGFLTHQEHAQVINDLIADLKLRIDQE